MSEVLSVGRQSRLCMLYRRVVVGKETKLFLARAGNTCLQELPIENTAKWAGDPRV